MFPKTLKGNHQLRIGVLRVDTVLHMTTIFTVSDCSESCIFLDLDDFLNAFVLQLLQPLLGISLLIDCLSLVQQLRWTK